LVAAFTPTVVWLNLAGSQAVVVWHDEHCAVVLIWLDLNGVQLLPV
jgi:hypothetical protein